LALASSAALHAGILALGLLSWGKVRELNLGSAVPVNIVSNAPSTDLRAALEAPSPQEALTEIPALDAPPEVSVPAAAPAPAPAKPPEKAAKADKGLDLDALAASLAKSAKASSARPASAAKGPARPETALQARPDLGKGLAANALAGMTEELQRRWNPNCEVEGGRDVHVRVTFTLGAGGQIVGQVEAGGQENAANLVAKAAAERAIRAVYQAAPFRNLPHQFYGDRIAVNFNAREACA